MSKKKIAIIGSGVVGKATGKGFLSWGHEVVFYDISKNRLGELFRENLNICETEECLQDQEVYTVSVCTPTIDGSIKLDFVKLAMATLGRVLRKSKKDYPVIAVRSTVPPGTTEKVFIPILEDFSGKKAGYDFGVAMNPEYLRENSAEEDFACPRIVVVGVSDSRTRDIMADVYGAVQAEKVFVSIAKAEAEKYGHNIWNATKISFCNELRSVLGAFGMEKEDVDDVLRLIMKTAEASWNPLYGTKPFGPFGGSCLPKDTQAFLAWAHENLGEKMILLESVIRVNDAMKDQD